MAESKEVVKKEIKSEELQAFHDDVMKVWTNTASIRRIFAPKLDDDEFRFFCGIGVAIGANPFQKEIFAVKYGTEPASIIVAKDFYQKRAQMEPDYQGMYCEAVYPFEKFIPNPAKGTVDHIPDTKQRYDGTEYVEPLGAYCVVMRKGKHPYYVWVPTREYVKVIRDKNTGEKRRTRFWQEQVETMIKKVALSQAHKGAYQGVFIGTTNEYDAEVEQMNREETSGELMENLTKSIQSRGQQNNKPVNTKPQVNKSEPEPEPPIEEVETTEVDENIFPAGHPWGGHNIERVNQKFKKFLETDYQGYVSVLYNKAKIKSPSELAKKFGAANISPDEIGPVNFGKIENFLKELKGQKSLL